MGNHETDVFKYCEGVQAQRWCGFQYRSLLLERRAVSS